MSRRGRDYTADREQAETDAQRNAADLARITRWLGRHGIVVEGRKYIHALEKLRREPLEPQLDAGWPDTERNR